MILETVILSKSVNNVYNRFEIDSLNDVPDFNLPEGTETVVGIDPGANSLGMTFGFKDKPVPVLMCVLKREKTKRNEQNTNAYITISTRIIGEILKKMNVKAGMMENQFLNPEYVNSYRVLTSMKDSIEGELSLMGINLQTTSPQAWKSHLLAPVKDAWNINLSKSNKEHVQKIVRDRYMSAYLISAEDATDSFGILDYYYYLNPTEDGGIITVNKNMTREKSHDVYFVIKQAYKDLEKSIEEADEVRKVFGRDELEFFTLTEELTLEENLRALTSESDNAFMTVFKPYGKAMPEIFRNRDTIGKMDNNTVLSLVGLRRNKKWNS